MRITVNPDKIHSNKHSYSHSHGKKNKQTKKANTVAVIPLHSAAVSLHSGAVCLLHVCRCESEGSVASVGSSDHNQGVLWRVVLAVIR